MNSTTEKTSGRTGLDALLTPKNSVLILIDHQPFQFANLRNMDPTLVLNNTIGLAKVDLIVASSKSDIGNCP